jgi:hypothetical protein
MASGARVCGGDDGLDRDDFDAIAYLNEHFPTEQSLNLIDPETGAQTPLPFCAARFEIDRFEMFTRSKWHLCFWY